MVQTLKNIYHYFVAVLAVLFYRYPAKKLVVIGVTGTDGKTTTACMIYHILKNAQKKVGLVSTLGAKIGDETIDIGLHVTTPASFVLQKLLRQMVNQQTEFAVIEATSHGLDQNRLVGCNFSYGVLTNITHEHLDYHKTFANYVRAKAKLFGHTKVNIINNDGPWFEAITKSNLPGKIVAVGLKEPAEFNPKSYPLKLQIDGDYNQANALAAIAVCKHIGIDDDVIRSALKSFVGVEGRLEKIKLGQPFQVVVDFAHTPNATKQVLSTLRKETKGRLIAMFGSAGLRDKTKRPITGETAAALADVCIITADDPATENVDDIINQIVPGCLKAGALEVMQDDLASGRPLQGHVFVRMPDRKKAIAFAIAIAKDSDIVALLSKGHQKSFSLGKQEIPWNEKQFAVDALKERGYGT